jgi:hypothetical protein
MYSKGDSGKRARSHLNLFNEVRMAKTIQRRMGQTQETELAELMSRLGKNWAEWHLLDRKKLSVAKEGGKLLAAVKDLVDHGKWIPWVQRNLPQINVRTAQNWKRIWVNWDTLEKKALEKAKSISDLCLVEALDLLRKPRPTRKATPHPPNGRASESETKTEGQSAYAQSADGITNLIRPAQHIHFEREAGDCVSNPEAVLAGQGANEEPAKAEAEQAHRKTERQVAPSSWKEYADELQRQLPGYFHRVKPSVRPHWADSTASSFRVGRIGDCYHLVVVVAGEPKWVFHSIDVNAIYDLLYSIYEAQ